MLQAVEVAARRSCDCSPNLSTRGKFCSFAIERQDELIRQCENPQFAVIAPHSSSWVSLQDNGHRLSSESRKPRAESLPSPERPIEDRMIGDGAGHALERARLHLLHEEADVELRIGVVQAERRDEPEAEPRLVVGRAEDEDEPGARLLAGLESPFDELAADALSLELLAHRHRRQPHHADVALLSVHRHRREKDVPNDGTVLLGDQRERWTPKFGQLAKVGSRPRKRSLACHGRDGVILLN